MAEIIPTRDKSEFFMRQVYLNAAQSKDPKTKIGAVLVRGDNVISAGFNGFPRKVQDLVARYIDRETKYQFVCHAEANTVSTAARLGVSTLDSVLFTQGIPCAECCKSLIQAGVRKFVLHKQWPCLVHSPKWVESTAISRTMMIEAGIEVEWLDKQLHLIGYLDGREITI